MTKKNILIASLLGLATVGGSAIAQDTGWEEASPTLREGPQGRQGVQGRRANAGQRLVRKLNLDAEQQALFQKGQIKLKKKTQRMRKKMKALGLERSKAMSNGDFDALHDIIDQQAELKAAMAHARLNAMQPFHETLSEEQLAGLQEMLQKRHQARKGRRGKRGRRQGPKRQQQGYGPTPDSDWDE